RGGPVPGPGVVVALEAVRVDGRAPLTRRSGRGEWQRAVLARAMCPRLVDENRVDPRVQRGSVREALDAADDGQPRLLNNLLGDSLAVYVTARNALHRRVVGLHERVKRLRVAGAHGVDQR